MSFSLSLFFSVVSSAGFVQLELDRAYEVDVPEQSDISGIRHCNGHLLAVSDRHDNKIFELKSHRNALLLETYHEIEIPEPVSEIPTWDAFALWASWLVSDKEYDWEGIDCRGKTLYLVSESYADVLKVTQTDARWVGVDIFEDLESKGYFNDRNTYFEGVAFTGNSYFFAIEREPRGLVRYKNKDEWSVSRLNATRAMSGDRGEQPQDVVDLQYRNGYLYTLERNQHVLCRRSVKDYEQKVCWAFDDVLLSAKYRYPDAEYGIAEGLSIAPDGIYIAVDNNGEERGMDDSRPLVFKFKFPSGW